MAGSRESIIGAIEFGTSTIRVLLGRVYLDDFRIEPLGIGEVLSDGVLAKGEIVDIAKARAKLVEALDLADLASDGNFSDCNLLCVSVTGGDIYGVKRLGVASVQNEDGRIGENEKRSAYDNALRTMRNSAAAEGMAVLSDDVQSYVVDGGTPVIDPQGMRAEKLETNACCIMAPQKYLDQISGAVRDVCSDDGDGFVQLIFSGLAAQLGAASEEERERGALVVDFGAGSVEYAFYHHGGLQAAGVLSVGFEHVLNDLSIALQLPIENLRKMAGSGELNKLFATPRDFFPVPSPRGKVRQVPSVTMETVVNARLDEIFNLIRIRLINEGVMIDANSSVILAGGGALFGPTLEAAQQAFQSPVYIGVPKSSGSKVVPEDPRYCALFGALCYAGIMSESHAARRKRKLNWLAVLDSVWDVAGKQTKRVMESFGIEGK